MDAGDDPSFGNVYPPTTASAPTASWHPALRPDSGADDSDDDFFDRYPGATPKKSQGTRIEQINEESDVSAALEVTDSAEETVQETGTSEAQSEELSHQAVSLAEDAGVPSHQHDTQIPAVAQEAEDHNELLPAEDVSRLAPGEAAEHDEQHLEDYIPETFDDEPALEPVDANVAGQGEIASEDDGAAPEENYEHQGDATEMESAQEPSAQVPLLEDEAPLPTPGDDRDSFFGALGHGSAGDFETHAAEDPVPPPFDRTFTNDFMESNLPQQVESQSKRPLSNDWPDIGDDRTFGEILASQQSPQLEERSLEEVAAEESVQVAAPDTELLLDDDLLPDDENEEDLTAAWQAAFDDDELLVEEAKEFDPSAIFGEDDEGFLEDDSETLAFPSSNVNQPGQIANSTSAQYTPANVQQSQQTFQAPNFGTPSSQVFDSFHGRSAGTPQTGLYDVYGQQGISQPPNQPLPSSAAQSFVDKAKGGYQSPYDLPMEVVKPRRRPQAPQQQPPAQPSFAVPPPRSSSYTSNPYQASSRDTASVANLSPPSSSHSGAPGSLPGIAPGSLPKSTQKTDSGFFADLPVAAKPRTRPTAAFSSPAGSTPPPPPGMPPQPAQFPQHGAPPPAQSSQFAVAPPPAPQSPSKQQPGTFGGLRQPERMPLLPDQSPSLSSQLPMPQAPAANSRYSPSSQLAPADPAIPLPNRYSPAPAPPSSTAMGTRYSPAPGAQPVQARNRYASAPSAALPPSAQAAHPFAPRTSSPLAAHTDKPQPALPLEAAQLASPSPPYLNGMRSISPEQQIQPSRYAPSDLVASAPDSTLGAPPQRPPTHSPVANMSGSAARSMTTSSTFATPSAAQPKRPALPHRRQFSRDLIFVPPPDERSQDPLERWKGQPIFHWSANGSVVSSFPKQTPFYSSAQQLPSVKCTPGSITVQDATSFLPLDEKVAKFPGPLTARNKGKKKDVLAWMTEKIEEIERHTENVLMDFSCPPELKKRVEEKLVLWKIVKIYVEQDGVLEGNPKIEEEVRRILLPNLAQMGQVAALQGPGATNIPRDPVDRQALFQLRQALLEGQRERAVWLAEEKKLWGHAMLIASTLGPETWRQIIQSFVRTQVKSFGSDTRSLAALYQIFAGNSDECIDELVPPSARAGFQMISKTNGSVTGNPLEGLDQWRETLGLVTSNRTALDGPSIIALGKLLGDYGRAEAAHTCLLFSRSLAKHSGADDSEANFVLLGSNHKPQDDNFANDLDSILLTEIYEYATSLTAPSNTAAYIPHLQSYKLIHAQELAVRGLKTKAQSYCDHITTAYTSTTRPSQYYHPTFTQSVAELSAFLSQTPHDGKSGFLSKPALKTVTSSAGNWFSKFVSGDEDNASDGSGRGGGTGEELAGPFGGVTGEALSLSRNASVTDLYNPMMGGAVPIPGAAPVPIPQSFAPSSAPSRYAPSSSHGSPGTSRYAPTSGSMAATTDQRPASARYNPTTSGLSGIAQAHALSPPSSSASDVGASYAPVPAASRRTSGHGSGTYAPVASSLGGDSAQNFSSAASYEPKPILADEPASLAYSPPTVVQTVPFGQETEQNGFAESAPPVPQSDEVADAEGGSGGYEPPTGGYEPPSFTYQPYEPEPESVEEDAPKPKKKMFGDDDDDDFDQRAAAMKKSQADREADDAFRKAAEADAARDNAKGDPKKGWFGGWFGGKKDAGAMPGPIRAKLGEESSFVYDETLKKWVNKKGGSETSTPSAPTPPPPRGPPSRVTSAGSHMGPPSGPPSRVVSGSVLGTVDSRPPTSGSGSAPPAPSMGLPGGPPSRASTPATSAPLMPHLPPGVVANGSAPPSRPSTGMSNASSLDDLLGGPPGTRKGNTVKGKKKGGRYVDVMAKS